MIRKGQVLGSTRQNLYGQAWVFRHYCRSDSPNSFELMLEHPSTAEAATLRGYTSTTILAFAHLFDEKCTLCPCLILIIQYKLRG
jgi:hypothetical protein